MRLVDLVGRHLFLSAAALGTAVGIGIGLFLPIQAAKPPKAEALEWKPPAASEVRRYREEDYTALSGARFLGAATPTVRRAGAGSWTLSAILTRPRVLAAVSINPTSAPKWVRVGGLLPDGARLVAIRNDSVTYELGGCRRTRELFQSTAAKNREKAEADACAGATRAAAPTTAASRPAAGGPPTSSTKRTP